MFISIRKYFASLNIHAGDKNRENILKLLEQHNGANLLDLGCGYGSFTLKVADKIGTNNVYAVEAFDECREVAEKLFTVKSCDLNSTFPYEDDFFDVVHSNQVIEHLHDLDNFIVEIKRVLKPDGYAIISTENLSSWHNIFVLLFGYQPFAISSLSGLKMSVGNPFGLARDLEMIDFQQHIRGLAYQGLIELFDLHRMKAENILAAGYYPLPNFMADIMSKIDKFRNYE